MKYQLNQESEEKIISQKHIGAFVEYWPSTRPNMPFQSDAPKGSDTFRCQLWEEIA